MTDEALLSKADLLARIQQGWDDLHTYLNTLTEEQLTTLTDAAGWTVKDHIAHMAAWEDSIYALFAKLNRREFMGVDSETWKSGDYDRINEVIRQRFIHLSLAEVLDQFDVAHQRVLAQIRALSDDDLSKPFNYFQPESKATDPVIGVIMGNTCDHYAEHTPWIAAIIADPK